LEVDEGGGAGVDKAKGKVNPLPGMLGGTAFKGNVEAEGTGAVVKKRAWGETRRSAARRGTSVHQRGRPEAVG